MKFFLKSFILIFSTLSITHCADKKDEFIPLDPDERKTVNEYFKDKKRDFIKIKNFKQKKKKPQEFKNCDLNKNIEHDTFELGDFTETNTHLNGPKCKTKFESTLEIIKIKRNKKNVQTSNTNKNFNFVFSPINSNFKAYEADGYDLTVLLVDRSTEKIKFMSFVEFKSIYKNKPVGFKLNIQKSSERADDKTLYFTKFKWEVDTEDFVAVILYETSNQPKHKETPTIMINGKTITPKEYHDLVGNLEELIKITTE